MIEPPFTKHCMTNTQIRNKGFETTIEECAVFVRISGATYFDRKPNEKPENRSNYSDE